MASPESQNNTHSHSHSLPEYSRYLEASTTNPNLAHVKDNEYGFYAAYVVDTFDSLPENSKNKIAKTGMIFGMPEERVEAILAYREQYPVTMEARIIVNKWQANSTDVRSEDSRLAEQVLFLSNNKKDPFVPWE